MAGLLTIGAATAALLVGSSTTSAVTNSVTLIAADSTATEAAGPNRTARYVVAITGEAPLTDVTVNYTVTGVQAADVTTSPASGFVLTDMAPSQEITVTAVDDDIDEDDLQNFTLNVTTTPNAVPPSASGTVADNDAPPLLSINNISANEGNAGTTAYNFTITASRFSERSPQVSWSASNGTAFVTEDFDPASGAETFGPAEKTKTATVNVRGDTDVEPNESFVVTLSAPVNATIGCPSAPCGVGTILNDDSAGAISIADLSVIETAGAADLVISRTGSTASSASVLVTTNPGTATSPGDFAATTTTATIPAGTASTTVPVQITNDTVDEPTEQFTVTLSNPIGGTIGDGSAVVTITDDDTSSQLAVNDPSANEPANGFTGPVTFTVSLSQASNRVVTVNYATASGTATSGTDFVAKSGTLTFNPGQSLTQTVAVTVNGDALNEPNETFTLQLSGVVGAVIGDASGQATIVDPSAPPSLTISDAVVGEGAGTVALQVTKTGTTAQTITVNYAGQSGANFPGATIGADFTLASGTLSFAAGETSKTITVGIADDATPEADETFQVVLSGQTPAGVTLTKGTSNVKIVDNDPGGAPPPSPPSGPRPPTLPTGNPPPPPPPTTTTTTTKPLGKKLTARVLSAKLIAKLQGRKRAAIRVTLNQKVSVRLVMVQGKKIVRSKPFELRAGNRTMFIVLPKNVKAGRVDFQLLLTTAFDERRTLKTKLVLET